MKFRTAALPLLLLLGVAPFGPAATGSSVDDVLPAGLHFYAGDLHTHTSYSDGSLTPADAFALARANGLNFLTVSEHSEGFGPALEAANCATAIDPAACALAYPPARLEWDEVARAAADATVPGTFVGLRGFEITYDLQGHINIFRSAGYTDRLKTPDGSMAPFWDWFAGTGPAIVLPNGYATSGRDGLGQFNHPNTDKNFIPGEDSWRWDDFAYVPAADDRLATIEVFNRGSNAHANWYPVALDAGWHVAPVGVSDTHDPNWGAAQFGRTVIVAPELSEASIWDAVEARHVAATRDPGLRLVLLSGDHLMGDRFSQDAADPVSLTVRVAGGSSPVTLVEIVSNGGGVVASGAPDGNGEWSGSVSLAGSAENYFYAKVTEANGSPAYTAPVWVTPT